MVVREPRGRTIAGVVGFVKFKGNIGSLGVKIFLSGELKLVAECNSKNSNRMADGALSILKTLGVFKFGHYIFNKDSNESRVN